MTITPKYDLEIGENCKPSVCHCCGRESYLGHGFIYKNGDAYAVYYVGWAPSHSDKKVSFAIAIGEWGDSSTSADRTCFGLEAYEGEQEILFRVIEPADSPWSNTGLLGKMISRQDALKHSLINNIFNIAEYVVRNHDSIQEYLNMKKTGATR